MCIGWDELPKSYAAGFYYSSGNNAQWLSVEQIRALLKTDLHE